jgi:cytochrome c oxidase subunit 2
VSKWWSVLFAVVMLACLGLFIAAPIVGWWLPKQASYHAPNIDFLFYVILYITGFFFILTETLLVVFMWRYAAEPGQKRVPAPADQAHAPPQGGLFNLAKKVIHDEHRLEMLWTIVPAVILLYIAFAQIAAWAEAKYQSRMPHFTEGENKTSLQMEVTARQWEWRFRYPSPHTMDEWKKKPDDAGVWARKAQFDDVHVVNELHTWKDQPTLIHLRTNDIIHSFFLPQMRVKQDALPGKVIPVWFTPKLYNCKRIEKYTPAAKDGKPPQPPDHDHVWTLRDSKATDKGYAWVTWVDGYEPNPEPGKDHFNDPSQIWELNCAELCGAFHYRMIGRVYVHESEADFRLWLAMAYKRQNDFGTTTGHTATPH